MKSDILLQAYRCAAPLRKQHLYQRSLILTHRDRAGDPPGASGSLDDGPHRLRLPSYPVDRPRDLYGSLSALLGIRLLAACFSGAGGRSLGQPGQGHHRADHVDSRAKVNETRVGGPKSAHRASISCSTKWCFPVVGAAQASWRRPNAVGPTSSHCSCPATHLAECLDRGVCPKGRRCSERPSPNMIWRRSCGQVSTNR